MPIKYILTLILLIHAIIGHCGILPTFSIVELAIRSDRIAVSTFLNKKDSDTKFLINDINNSYGKPDTLVLQNLDQFFYDLSYFEQADSILIFLTNNQNGELTWSGMRLLKDDTIYLPVQNINPGKYTFGVPRDINSWAELVKIVVEVEKRVNYVKQIKKEKDNRKLFKWIEKDSQELAIPSIMNGSNKNIGWGSFGWDVFKWITENNIASDTWNASKLFRKIHCSDEKEWLGYTGILTDENGTSFTSYKDIKFLVKESLKNSNSVVERKQALIYLKLASRKVYENNYPIPEQHKLNEQRDKQTSIRNKILPLLNNEELKRYAFGVVRSMSNPMDGNLEHRIDLEILPTIEHLYKNETPGDYKSELAEFIVHNSSKEEWKILSNCDEKIFVDLYQVYVDTIQNVLTFGINYDYGKEQIRENPIVVVENIKTKQIVREQESSGFKVPYNSWNGVRYIEISIEGLTSGTYKVYTKGKAGENSKFNWISEYGEFQVK